MNKEVPKDAGLILFPVLAKLGIATTWASLDNPEVALRAECQRLASDGAFMVELAAYLESNPIIRASGESMLAQLAFSAGVRWQDTAPVLHPLSRRGWHISRWLPTFLLLDGPLGRLLTRGSPLTKRMRGRDTGLPLLSEGRDAFNTEIFRLLRNGFGHWSFEWIDKSPMAEIRVVDWETGKETARASLLECEGLHHLTVSVVRAIDQEIFALLKSTTTT